MAKRGENIYKRKDGRYEGRYIKGRRMDGKPLFGYIYGYTYSEVKIRLNMEKAAVRQDKALHVFGDGTVACYLQFWLTRILPDRLKPSTLARYRENIRLYILPEIGNMQISKVTSHKIQHIVHKLTDSGLSPATVTGVVRLFSSAMKQAVELKLAAHNPCDGVTTPVIERTPARILNRQEQIKLERQAAMTGAGAETGILLALYAGLRIGEICALQWRDIDFFQKTLTVRATLQRMGCEQERKTILLKGTPKSKSSARCIPIPPDLMDKLLKHKNESGGDCYILTNTLKPVEPRTLRARFARLSSKAGISVPFHTLRHTFAARCLECHFDIQALSEIMGHSNAGITLRVYSHSVLEHKRMLTDRLRILSNKPSNEPSAKATG